MPTYAWVSAPVPELGENSVLIENTSAGVNFIDTLIDRGEVPPEFLPELPFVQGVEGAGKVIAIGDQVENVSVGDSVMWFGLLGSGGYGKHSVVESQYVAKVSENVDLEAAGGIPVTYLTAHYLLNIIGEAKKDDYVLVHAASGGVGTAVQHLANLQGVNIIASVSERKIYFALKNGAVAAINYRTESVSERATELSGGGGVALSLNPIGGTTVSADIDALAPFGKIINFGFIAGHPTGDFARLADGFIRSISIEMFDIYSYYQANPQQFQEAMEYIAELVSSESIQPVLHGRLPVSDAVEAHRQLQEGEVLGKLVLIH